MQNSQQTLERFTGHTVEGALRFRNDLSVGMPAPDFALKALDGSAVRLSDYRRKAHVVLTFGSFTCGSTVTQLRDGKPSLGSLYRRFKRKDFQFLLIYSREQHPGENVPQAESYE